MHLVFWLIFFDSCNTRAALANMRTLGAHPHPVMKTRNASCPRTAACASRLIPVSGRTSNPEQCH
jgi:hypothetical protein